MQLKPAFLDIQSIQQFLGTKYSEKYKRHESIGDKLRDVKACLKPLSLDTDLGKGSLQMVLWSIYQGS